jgi:hypothetical protein
MDREPQPMRRRPAAMSTAVRLILAAVMVGIVAGCGAIGPSLIPDRSGPLVTVTTRGGECFEGPCGSVIAIAQNGEVHAIQPAPAELGEVPAEILSALDAQIKTADFATIRAVPFEGECPVNFDGQEIIYEFGAPSGAERLATCETQIDPDHPLFLAVDAALQAVGSVPVGG